MNLLFFTALILWLSRLDVTLWPLVARERVVGLWLLRVQLGRASSRGLSEICMVRCLYVCSCVHVWDWLWAFFSQQRRQKVSHCDLRDISTLIYTWNYYYTLGTISQLLFSKSVWEMDVWVILVVRVWWKILSSCSEIGSVFWGCIHHRCLFNFCDGSEASSWFTK